MWERTRLAKKRPPSRVVLGNDQPRNPRLPSFLGSLACLALLKDRKRKLKRQLNKRDEMEGLSEGDEVQIKVG